MRANAGDVIALNDDGSVVAVDDPSVGRCDGTKPGHELIRIDWLPPRQVVNCVQLNVGNIESRGNASSKPRLAGTSISDNRHAPHSAMMAEPLLLSGEYWTVDSGAAQPWWTSRGRGVPARAGAYRAKPCVHQTCPPASIT